MCVCALEKEDVDVNVSVMSCPVRWLCELKKIRNLGVLFRFGIMREG